MRRARRFSAWSTRAARTEAYARLPINSLYSLLFGFATHFSFRLLADNLCESVLCTRATFDVAHYYPHTSALIHQMNRLGLVRGR
jgi:hypothetical protein